MDKKLKAKLEAKAKSLTVDEIIDLMREAALLEEVVNDLCEHSSAEDTYDYLCNIGKIIKITEQEIAEMGFAPMGDDEE